MTLYDADHRDAGDDFTWIGRDNGDNRIRMVLWQFLSGLSGLELEGLSAQPIQGTAIPVSALIQVYNRMASATTDANFNAGDWAIEQAWAMAQRHGAGARPQWQPLNQGAPVAPPPFEVPNDPGH